MTAGELTDLARAASPFAWPILVGTLACVFRHPLAQVLRNVSRVRVGGYEILISGGLNSLQIIVAELNQSGTIAGDSRVQREVLKTAKKDPRVALVLLNNHLVRSVQRFDAPNGWLPVTEVPRKLWDRLFMLSENAGQPPDTMRAMFTFAMVQEAILASDERFSRAEIVRAISFGLTILAVIDSLPRPVHTVVKAGIMVFADELLTEAIEGTGAIQISSQEADGMTRNWFLTRRTHYREGMEVAWTWSLDNRFAHGYIRDPDTGTVLDAGCGALEFVGRDMKDFE